MAETSLCLTVKELKAECAIINWILHEYNVARKARKLTPQERAHRDELRDRLYFIIKELRKGKVKPKPPTRIHSGGFEIWTEPQATNNSEEVHKEKKRTPKVYSHATEEKFYYHGKLRTATEIRNLISGLGTLSTATNSRRKRKTKAKTNTKVNPNLEPQRGGGMGKKQKDWNPNPAKWKPDF